MNVYTILVGLWLAWLILGTVFYSVELQLNWMAGFYMAVNIGYSIGYGDIVENGRPTSQWFSIFYVLCGSSFVAAALGVFANRIVSSDHNWYENELRRIKHETVMQGDSPFYVKLQYLLSYHWVKIRSILLFFIMIVAAIALSMATHKSWSFVNALYFAVSSLSTGGHFAMDPEQENSVYLLVGLYAALGIPIMGVAMATAAEFFIHPGNSIADTIVQLKEPVTPEEIQMLTDFKMADDDGEIDQMEFIILCMVRLGAASPQLITLIRDHFHELDTDGSGTLSMEELCSRVSNVDMTKTMENVHKQANKTSLFDVNISEKIRSAVVEPLQGAMDTQSKPKTETGCAEEGSQLVQMEKETDESPQDADSSNPEAGSGNATPTRSLFGKNPGSVSPAPPSSDLAEAEEGRAAVAVTNE